MKMLKKLFALLFVVLTFTATAGTAPGWTLTPTERAELNSRVTEMPFWLFSVYLTLILVSIGLIIYLINKFVGTTKYVLIYRYTKSDGCKAEGIITTSVGGFNTINDTKISETLYNIENTCRYMGRYNIEIIDTIQLTYKEAFFTSSAKLKDSIISKLNT